MLFQFQSIKARENKDQVEKLPSCIVPKEYYTEEINPIKFHFLRLRQKFFVEVYGTINHRGF